MSKAQDIADQIEYEVADGNRSVIVVFPNREVGRPVVQEVVDIQGFEPYVFYRYATEIGGLLSMKVDTVITVDSHFYSKDALGRIRHLTDGANEPRVYRL